MSNKITGIITFHNSYNCGSMLQAYALQRYLTSVNEQNEIINFIPEGQAKVYSVYAKDEGFRGFIKNCVIYFHRKKIVNAYNKYEEFKNNNLVLSADKFTKSEDIMDFPYKAVIAGSDQIWNVTIDDFDKAYFLPWAIDCKKIAYAPSLGSKDFNVCAKHPERISEDLKDFDALSVREYNGREWIYNSCGIVPKIVLDPTLLIDKDEYIAISDKTLNLPEKYIFYYSSDYSKDINEFVKQISKKYNMPVIAFNARSFYLNGLNFNGFNLPENEGPSAYLTLIQNASLVITTSFHGTIFSSIFNKKFWTIKNGNMFNDDDRVSSLADMLDLTDRIILPKFDDDFDYFADKDYSQYEVKLRQLRRDSVNYLEKALQVEDD